MLLNKIAMFLLMIMVFLTVFPRCLKLDTLSFFPSIKLYLFFTKHILKDSGNTFTGIIGVLDTSFNFPNGFIIQPIGSSDDVGSPLAIQSDGKILLGGSCKNGSNINFCIARFNSDGTLDTTFGTRGKVIQLIGTSHDGGNSLAIQSDGKILLGGSCKNGSNINFCIARFNSDGTLDTTFGTRGKVIQLIGTSHDGGNSLAIQSDGKILLGGSCKNGSNIDFCIARFNFDGTLDTTFGSSGKVIQPIGSSHDWGRSLVIQPDGKILLGGDCKNGSNKDFCIARFNSDGTLDTTFGTRGKVIQPIGSDDDRGESLAIQPDGKILLGGYCNIGDNYNKDFCIARFNSDGTLDTSFGSSGKVIQPIGSSIDEGYSLAIQPDGKILLRGSCDNGSNLDFCIARFNSNGTLDTTFGFSGKVIQPIGSFGDYGLSLAIQPDGKILLGGYCAGDFCIARFNSNGTLDTTFGSSGKVIQPIGSSNDFGRSLVIQPDGKILLGGYCAGDFCIARFDSNGTLDASFGSSGKVIQPIGSSDDAGQSLAIQPDGKILLGGYCFINTSNYDFCIARFNFDGTLDTSFGTSGKVIQHIGSYYDYCYGQSLAIQPDGKILLGGRCSNTNRGYRYFCIARFK
jgi:uncharacterized delta-60 repeat protein